MENRSNKEILEELWVSYKPYYLQHQDGIQSAATHVFEHAVKEMRLVDELDEDGEMTEADLCNVRDMAVSVIENLMEEGKVSINNISSQVQCSRCKKFAKGVIRSVTLPCGEIYEHERLCYMCAG